MDKNAAIINGLQQAISLKAAESSYSFLDLIKIVDPSLSEMDLEEILRNFTKRIKKGDHETIALFNAPITAIRARKVENLADKQTVKHEIISTLRRATAPMNGADLRSAIPSQIEYKEFRAIMLEMIDDEIVAWFGAARGTRYFLAEIESKTAR